MSKKWTRNQKIAVWGVAIAAFAAVGNWVHKIEVKVQTIFDKVDKFEAKVAKINQLETRVAKVEKLSTGEVRTKRVIFSSNP